MSQNSTSSPFDAEAIRAFKLEDGKTVDQPALNANARRIASQVGHRVLSPRLLTGAIRLVEAAILVVVGTLVFTFSSSVGFSGFVASILSAALCVLIANLLHAYEPRRLRSRTQSLRMGIAVAITALVMASFATIVGWAGNPSVWLVAWLPAAILSTQLFRTLLRACVRRWVRNGFLERRVVLVGGGSAAETFIRALERQPDSDIRVCGIFDDRDDRRSPPIVAGYPKLGSIAELSEFARLAKIDMLIVTLPLSAERRILSILKQLWILPLDIRLSASSSDMSFPSRRSALVGSVETIGVMDRPLREWDAVRKRVFDVVLGTMALVALSPIMLATALAIRLDTPGPIFFRQKRHGFNNQTINVWKFRSLRHDMADPSARKLVTRNDPRVTRVGRFIRRSSIDELPQLFNVLTGELSLVGPRPHAVHAVSSQNETFLEIVDGYLGRHKVKPGITGWAQIKGWRGEIDSGEKLQHRFEHDLYYIENWSLLLDLRILLSTPVSLLKPGGAY